MPRYILLSKLTNKGRQTLDRKPDRLALVNLEIKDLGFNVISQWATVGAYDFVTIVEVESNEKIAQLSILLGSRGTISIETLAAIPLDDLIGKLHGPRQLGRNSNLMRDRSEGGKAGKGA